MCHDCVLFLNVYVLPFGVINDDDDDDDDDSNQSINQSINQFIRS